MHSQPHKLDRNRTRICAVAVFLIAVAVFLPALRNGFVFDDVPIIEQNQRLSSPWNVREFFVTPYWQSHVEGPNLYRPFTLWSFAVDRAIFGEGPFGPHFTNVILNGLVSVLVFALAVMLLDNRMMACAAALLYAVSPVHVEVVANGVGRGELGAAACVLAGILMHLRARVTTGGVRAAWMAGALTAYLAGLLFKESAAMLPPLVLVCDWLILERGRVLPLLRHIGEYFAYALPLGIYLLLRFNAVPLSRSIAPEVADGPTRLQQISFSIDTLMQYILQLAAPITLIADYASFMHPLSEWSAVDAIPSLVFWIIVIAACIVLAVRGWRLPLLGFAFFLIAILPASNLIIPASIVRGDRFVYLPSVGIALLVGWLIGLAARRMPAATSVALSLAIIVYSWRTIVRTVDWRTQESMCEAIVRDNPGNAGAWAKLGELYQDQQDIDAAIDAYARAMALYDGSTRANPSASLNYAQLLYGLGRTDEAIARYRLLLEKHPDWYEALLNLGSLLFEQDRTDEAIATLKRATTVDSNRYEAFANLGLIDLQLGRPDRALPSLRRAAQLRPDLPLLQEKLRECEAALQGSDYTP